MSVRNNRESIRKGFQEMNNLSNLLSPTANNMLSRDLSLATIQKKKNELIAPKETWIQKLKKGNNYAASPDKVEMAKRLKKGVQNGGDVPTSMQESMLSLMYQ
jgi:hypothetical protein